jgi:hypothetical protein
MDARFRIQKNLLEGLGLVGRMKKKNKQDNSAATGEVWKVLTDMGRAVSHEEYSRTGVGCMSAPLGNERDEDMRG